MIHLLAERTHNSIYLKRYIRLMLHALSRSTLPDGPKENHHILPKGKGWWPEYKKDPNNIVRLTPKEHYVAHHLLALAYGGSMWYAYWRMCTKGSRNNDRHYKVSSRAYQKAKTSTQIVHSRALKGRKNPKVALAKTGMVNCVDLEGNNLFLTQQEFHSREDVAGVAKGNKFSKKSQEKLSRALKGKNKGKTHIHKNGKRKFVPKDELNDFLANGWALYRGSYNRDDKKKLCGHCGRLIDPTNFARWHGEKCKTIR